MFRSVVYHRNSLIGEVEIHPKNSNLGTWTREIRISHISHPPSDRCPPLAILHTISTSGVCFMMESKRSADESLLFSVYSACLRENKTAVASVGEEELHLVAMPSRRNIPRHSCFCGYIIARGLYNSCLAMLNCRCLGIVFDLDETLLVANTMRSLEDKIDGLQRMIGSEMDPQRANGTLAVIKRYQDDKSILKQYVDGDQVVVNGKVFKTQSEAVPPLFGSHHPLTRPIIRLHENNIILTRVNPSIRDTSVIVRLRPAWEDLRNCLTSNGRKWFEVYVCTMSERDYAFEMWRLLDPECNLINSSELLDRIVCVKSGLRKSLFNVFQDGACHPKMSLVIDDRLEVWDEKDQSRVLVVPPFAPHFGPQAEANKDIPVLCAARNLACNVRGSFFKDFDQVLLPRMSEILYEDEVEYPSVPDVGNYLIPKDDASTLIGNKNPLGFDGMEDAEVERRLKGVNRLGQSIPPIADNFDTRAVVPSGPTVTTPTPGRDGNLFKSSKLPKVQQEIVSFLANEQQDTHYYLPLSPAAENVTLENTTLKLSLDKPQKPEEEVLTQRGVRKMREEERRERGDHEEAESSDEMFPLIGSGGNLRDLTGKPLMRWNAKGKHVSVSTSLPSWKSDKVTRHAGAVTTALYGRKNLKEMRDIPVRKLPSMVAQAQARSTVMSHFMGCALHQSLKETKILYEELEKAYDQKNPKFIKEVIKHCKDTCQDTFNWLGARDGLKEGFESVGFADIYPGITELDIDAAIAALGESDEDEEDVEGEGGEEEEEKKEKEGEKGEENKDEREKEDVEEEGEEEEEVEEEDESSGTESEAPGGVVEEEEKKKAEDRMGEENIEDSEKEQDAEEEGEDDEEEEEKVEEDESSGTESEAPGGEEEEEKRNEEEGVKGEENKESEKEDAVEEGEEDEEEEEGEEDEEVEEEEEDESSGTGSEAPGEGIEFSSSSDSSESSAREPASSSRKPTKEPAAKRAKIDGKQI